MDKQTILKSIEAVANTAVKEKVDLQEVVTAFCTTLFGDTNFVISWDEATVMYGNIPSLLTLISNILLHYSESSGISIDTLVNIIPKIANKKEREDNPNGKNQQL